MTRGAPRRLVAVTLGALAFGAIVAVPRATAEARRPAATTAGEHAVASPAAASVVESARPPSWVDRVDAQLALRIPQLGDSDRRRIARTLVYEADAARIDPLLVLALIQIESSFDPAALSNRGARGLMQLREPTLRREVERAGLSWDEAHHPAVNVQAGIRYLRRLLDAFGAEEVALMAYNAGPNRILSYLRGGEIPERFHAYPRKVKAELRRLRRSFGQERVSFGPERRTAVAAARTPALPE